MLIVIIRAIILYSIVIASMRLMGKKQLGELTPTELVTTILISNIATLSLEDPSIPLVLGVLPILMIVCLDVFSTHLVLKSLKFRQIIGGKPRIIISNGTIDQKELKNLRYTIDDVMESMREHEIFDINEVQYAIVETTGKINFYTKTQGNSNPPTAIIMDGELSKEGLSQSGLGERWLKETLRRSNTTQNQVFLLTANQTGAYTLILKENKQ